jgi:lysophospholipase L1-like esterase
MHLVKVANWAARFVSVRVGLAFVAVAALVLIGAVAAMAQPATSMTSHPPVQTAPVPPSAVRPPLSPEQVEQLRTDWPNLKRYGADDEKLVAAPAVDGRVVFMGDSITEGWLHNGLPAGSPGSEFFPGKPYVNRGISGQTTPQMLIRFRPDVIALKPAAVVLFAGINDVAGNTGDMTSEQTEDNLASMAELAQAHGIKVVMCSILPAFDFPWRPGREPVPKVAAINAWMKSYAESHEHVYVDFYSATVDARGGLPEKLSKDGVHPNNAGYLIMNPLAEAGIEKALGGK